MMVEVLHLGTFTALPWLLLLLVLSTASASASATVPATTPLQLPHRPHHHFDDDLLLTFSILCPSAAN